MKALFLESLAAAQIRMSAEGQGLDQEGLEDLLSRVYGYGESHPNFLFRNSELDYPDWWVDQCLRGDEHKEIDVNSLFVWGSTPEGHDLWKVINRLHPEGAEQ